MDGEVTVQTCTAVQPDLQSKFKVILLLVRGHYYSTGLKKKLQSEISDTLKHVCTKVNSKSRLRVNKYKIKDRHTQASISVTK